jgi:hypothetical protein
MLQRPCANLMTSIGAVVVFAPSFAYSQVRPEIRIVETLTLHTRQILRGERNGTPALIAGELRIPPGFDGRT